MSNSTFTCTYENVFAEKQMAKYQVIRFLGANSMAMQLPQSSVYIEKLMLEGILKGHTGIKTCFYTNHVHFWISRTLLYDTAVNYINLHDLNSMNYVFYILINTVTVYSAFP